MKYKGSSKTTASEGMGQTSDSAQWPGRPTVTSAAARVAQFSGEGVACLRPRPAGHEHHALTSSDLTPDLILDAPDARCSIRI